jgi:hypothetical protein
MFNRELRIRTVKIDPRTTTGGEQAVASTSPEQINELAKDFVTHNGETATEVLVTAGDIAKDIMKTTAKLAVGVLVVSFVLTVASEIIAKSLEQN